MPLQFLTLHFTHMFLNLFLYTFHFYLKAILTCMGIFFLKHRVTLEIYLNVKPYNIICFIFKWYLYTPELVIIKQYHNLCTECYP